MFSRFQDYRGLESNAECYRVLQSVTECYRVLESVTECYRVLQSVTDCYRVLQSVTECYRVLQSISSASTWANFWACLSRISLEKRLPSNLVQARWRGQLSTQQGASTPFISDSLLRKLSASLLLSFIVFIILPHFSFFTGTPCSQINLRM